MKFYYDVYGHPSPDFRCFDPVVHYFMPDTEDIAKNRGVFSCCFMGRGMREFIAHQPPTWHQLKFHDAEPLADAGVPGDPTHAIQIAFEEDEHKFGEYLVLQITEGGAYVLEMATLEVVPLLDCSSKTFSASLDYNKIRRGDILRGVEPIYVPDHLACQRYYFPNDPLVKGSLDPGDAHKLITDHVMGTSPVQKILRLKYGNKWKKSKAADKRIIDYIVNVIRPKAKTVSVKGDPLYEFFNKSEDRKSVV